MKMMKQAYSQVWKEVKLLALVISVFYSHIEMNSLEGFTNELWSKESKESDESIFRMVTILEGFLQENAI